MDTKDTPPVASLPTITITLQPDMSIRVDGAITNKMMAFGMLECAKEAIIDYHRALISDKRIVAPPSGFKLD